MDCGSLLPLWNPQPAAEFLRAFTGRFIGSRASRLAPGKRQQAAAVQGVKPSPIEMKPSPIWLTELHRQWHASRGRRVSQTGRAFTRDWAKLLEDAGITRTEDQATASREAELLEKDGKLLLKRHRYRKYLIERITLPLASEPWLRSQFGVSSGMELQEASLEIVDRFSKLTHRVFPDEWSALCASLISAFRKGRSLRPFDWTNPERLQQLLGVVGDLSSRDWPPGTLVRNASVELGLDSKALERHQRSIESALTRLFGSSTSYQSLGLVCGEGHVELHGPICLHFPDGSIHDFDGLSQVLISAADLARCSHVTTTAVRLLSIENRKTTFRQYAAANTDRRTLIAATSFPTPAFRCLLEKLPMDLPHDHFGDTDPAGWHILLKLREATPRRVGAFRMKWRPAEVKVPLTPYDKKLLERLITSTLLDDVRGEIRMMMDQNDRGDFEQETLEMERRL
ncbi:MAG: hypothetical protein MUF13_03410 [Akkermansiaceae bacterium]|nr:hypothetical protein [Akkermansiaceae bacterium]